MNDLLVSLIVYSKLLLKNVDVTMRVFYIKYIKTANKTKIALSNKLPISFRFLYLTFRWNFSGCCQTHLQKPLVTVLGWTFCFIIRSIATVTCMWKYINGKDIIDYTMQDCGL